LKACEEGQRIALRTGEPRFVVFNVIKEAVPSETKWKTARVDAEDSVEELMYRSIGVGMRL
jgi:hypothetical protein